ncbi:MAG: hypothetical protein IJ223_03340 [Clostridia bacterium]|nr:hypothetical protein [Clostridia bacterium]
MKGKRLEIIDGDGSNIDMSPVHVHINSIKPKSNEKKKKVIIPKEKKNK